MKKMIKIWDVILLALIGILGSGCITDPEPEYGVEALYGVIAEYQDVEEETQELPSEELK